MKILYRRSSQKFSLMPHLTNFTRSSILFKIISGGANNDFLQEYYPPPPPHKSFCSNYLACSLLFGAIFFYSCDPPPSTPTYTTTVSGKIITPAKAKDSSKGSFITTAEVRANGAKAKTNSEGSYELKVKHSGTFQIFVDYTPTDPRKRNDYKQGAPQTITTTEETESLNIPLNYGYTLTLSGQVVSTKVGDTGRKKGATVTIEVEGLFAGSTKTSGNGNYSITFSHNGTYKATASLAGFISESFQPVDRVTEKTKTGNFIIR